MEQSYSPTPSPAPVTSALKAAVGQAVDLVLPPRCLKCGDIVQANNDLCGPCWAQVSFIAAPFCHCCGLPFEYDEGENSLCGGCAATPPAFDQVRAAFRYDQASRDLILRFKHGDRLEGAGALAAWLQRCGTALLAEVDLIVPVPLHRRRLFLRRYNQAAVLAHALGRRTSLPVASRALTRVKPTPSQGHLGRAARFRNLSGAIALAPDASPKVKGHRILLVDDVMTSGATLNACAKALKSAGAKSVHALVLARVLGKEEAQGLSLTLNWKESDER